MDLLILMFILFVVLSPVVGFTAYSGQRRVGPGQPNQQLYGPQQRYPQPGYGRGYGQGYGQMQPYGGGMAQQQYVSPEAFQASKDALSDDITGFGNELRDLDLEVVGRELSSEANDDYTRALDAYDGAKATLERTQHVGELKRVAEILEEGRFAVASVQARVHDKPLPQRRPPCFFDPSHGPSVKDVTWAPAGGSARQVPACARDAQRVELGADPSIRMVGYGNQLQPYWENQAYVPYAQGYYGRYGMDPTMQSLAKSAIVFGGLGLLFGMLGD